MTQLESAKKGIITEEMKIVALDENISPDVLVEDIKAGYTVITKNKKHGCTPLGIGKDLKIKINANIGTSGICYNLEKELEKLKVSIKYGADTVMDLSTGGDLNYIRKVILAESPVPVGTVPIYQSILGKKDISEIKEEDFLNSIYDHINDGIDFITLHSGLLKDFIPLLSSRIMGVVSRGGSILVKWMLYHQKENPLYSRFDEILAMAKENDVVLSLGDGLRPGCLSDATDKAQLAELKILGELAFRAKEKSVQVIIEGPGHVPLDQIKKNIELQKEYCHGAPFYVLGPLVTDCAPGYDHITGAIGGALAGYFGADFLCYLTPVEHLGLPDTEHVIEGVIASRIAAHAADIARGLPAAKDIDDKMSLARSKLDWDAMFSHAMNPEKAKSLRNQSLNKETDVCSMCGELCSAKINIENRKNYQEKL